MSSFREKYEFNRERLSYYVMNMADYAKRLAGNGFKAPPPKTIRIEPAYTCNLRCSFCSTIATSDAEKPNGGLMREETFERILEQVAPVEGIEGCVFYVGGEPLLNKKLASWVARVNNETSIARTAVSTNGMPLTERIARELLEAGITQIRISIDGKTPEDNDRIRIRSSYDRIRENVQRLQKMAKGTGTKVQVVNGLLAERSDLVPHIKTPKVPDHLARDFGEENVFTNFIAKWPWPKPASNQPQLEEPVMVVRSKHHHAKLKFCTTPFAEMNFLYDGSIGVCCRDLTRNMIMGNVETDHFLDVWRSGPYKNFRRGVATFGLLGDIPDMCSKGCSFYTGEMMLAEEATVPETKTAPKKKKLTVYESFPQKARESTAAS